jgi:glutamyl-Q tRNA(Asp) synthetase
VERAIAAARGVLRGAPLAFTEIGEDGVAHRVEARPERWGDCVLVRKDVPASYLLAATLDDARQGVTHVTRGRDLFAATDMQRLIQVLLGWPEPVYHHHRLVTDAQGRKLAKSARDTSLRSLRADGVTAAEIRRRVGMAD